MERAPRGNHQVGHGQVDQVEVDGGAHGLVEDDRQDDQDVPQTRQHHQHHHRHLGSNRGTVSLNKRTYENDKFICHASLEILFLYFFVC